MDKLERYRSIIKRELTAIVEQTKRAISPPPGLRDKTVFDRQSDYYLILREGWDGSRRIHGPVVSLEIIDGKVWLQADNTDLRVAERLEDAGISKADIVLGFQPPHVRPYTEYAVA
jgi:XisI protein